MQRIIETSDFFSVLIKELTPCKKVMFVYSPSFVNRRGFDRISEIPHVAFSGFEPNPDYESIVKGSRVFETHKCDCIVSIGGGSSIDVAKGIKHILGKADLIHIAIPTTAGTGSESTQFAVIYKKGKKISLDYPELLPTVAILDGVLLQTLPDFQKRCTLLDALCQCIESHWSIGSTEESRKYSLAGLETILSNYERYLRNDSDASKKILYGANLSGRAINISRTTISHAISYTITTMYGMPHGCSVALTIVQFWEHLITNMEQTTHPLGRLFMESRLLELSHVFGGDSLLDGPLMSKQLISKIWPRFSLDSLDLRIVSSNCDANRIKNYPLKMDPNTIEKVLNSIKKI